MRGVRTRRFLGWALSLTVLFLGSVPSCGGEQHAVASRSVPAPAETPGAALPTPEQQGAAKAVDIDAGATAPLADADIPQETPRLPSAADASSDWFANWTPDASFWRAEPRPSPTNRVDSPPGMPMTYGWPMEVFFPLGSSDVSNISERQWRTILEKFYLRPIQVHGYADPREGAAAQRLSVERAQNIRKGLIACGVDPSRVTAVGHGTAGRRIPPKLLLDPERLSLVKFARVELTDGVSPTPG